MGNQVTLTFAGDADSIDKAAKKADAAITTVGDSATSANAEFDKAAAGSSKFGAKMGALGSTVTGATDAIDAVGGSLQALSDIQQYSTNRAARLARALNDVSQAQEDYNQALLDGKQAAVDSNQYKIDAEQAALDARVALKDYNAAVKEHGKNSDEAKQAQLDLKQAQQDSKQATVDQEQATRDLAQSQIDATGAQLDLADAQREAKPPAIQEWADKLAVITPLLTALVGIIGLIVGVQWAWNIAMTANPVGLIIAGIALLIGVIVLIATKTTWFQDIWSAAWGWIKKTALSFWDWLSALPAKIGSVFLTVAGFITKPFRAAFNFISDAWNHTIGSLSWTIPAWIPGIGGNTIAVPNLPKFHSGGVVPGTPGQEVMAVLQAGERVSPASSNGNIRLEIHSGGSRFDDVLVEIIANAVRRRGGDVQLVLGAGSRG